MEVQHDFDDGDLTWHLQVYRDSDDAVLCLESLRRVYPTSRIVMVSDGDDDARWPELAQQFNIEYSKGEHLYGLESGGQLWKRVLHDSLQHDASQKLCSHILKIDTDTRIHRRFRFLPTGCVVFGTLEHRTEVLQVPLNPPNVQGGFTGFTRQAAQKILDSSLLDSDEMPDWKQTYADVPDALWAINQRPYVIGDLQLRTICKRLNIAVADFSEVRSNFLAPPEIGDFAVTHPHKVRPRTTSKSAIRRVLLMRTWLRIQRRFQTPLSKKVTHIEYSILNSSLEYDGTIRFWCRGRIRRQFG